MIVVDVFIHEAFQMPFIQNDHMVEQVPAAASDPTLGNAILPRTPEAGALGLNAEALHCLDHFAAEVSGAIKNQVAGCRVEGERLAQLLSHPSAGRVFRHIAMQDSSPVMCDNKEAIQHTERNRRTVKKPIAAIASR